MFRVSALVLVAATVTAAPAAVAQSAAAPVVSAGYAAASAEEFAYDEWKHRPQFGAYGGTGPRGFYGLWDHDEELEVRAGRVARYWAEFSDGYYNWLHPRYYTFLDPTTSGPPMTDGNGFVVASDQLFQARFLEEARAAGDIIVEFEGRRDNGGPLYPVYAVFAAGTAPDRVALDLVMHLAQRGNFFLSYEERVSVLAAYRGTLGLMTTAADYDRIYMSLDGRSDAHPPPTYREWLYGVYRVRQPVIYWPHDQPIGALLRSVPRPFMASVWIGDGDDEDAYEAQWLAEAIAAGDIVIPVATPSILNRRTDPSRPLLFVVFASGVSPEVVEHELPGVLSEEGIPRNEAALVIETYRRMVGVPIGG